MKTYHLGARLLLCLALLFCASGGLSCRQKAAEEPNTETPDTNAPKVTIETAKPDVNEAEPKTGIEKTDQDVAVTVNGFKITEPAVDALVKPVLDRMAAQARQLPPQYLEQYKKNIRAQALEKMIVERILDEKVELANIAVSDQEVTDKLTEIASKQNPPMSLEEFEKKAAEYGQSFEEVREQLGRQLTYEKLLEPQWAGKIDFNDQDAKKYYDENLKRYTSPEQVRASHILITPDTSDPNTDPNQAKAKALAKTRELLKQINEGADFAELARANSKDPGSASRGGDLDYFPRGRMKLPFEKAAFELEVGKISDIVETDYGYHIIKVTDHKDDAVTPFEEVREGIIEQLTQRKKSEFAKEYIESLRAKTDIVYPPGKEPTMSMPPGAPAPGR